jgi:hypothetical protein
MKLEQIIPYLPYQLKGYGQGEVVEGTEYDENPTPKLLTLVGVCNHYLYVDGIRETIEEDIALTDFIPILYPLYFFNDMTIGQVKEFLDLKDIKYVEKIWHLEWTKIKVEELTYDEFTTLVSLKIDVFNLIPKGFAIPVTNEFNPYKL